MHPVYGCVDDGDGNIVNGFTLVGDDGQPAFPPVTLTSLGFADCCSDSTAKPTSDLWTLFSKEELGDGSSTFHIASQFPNAVQVADVDGGTGQLHPTDGSAIGNWNIFAICSPTQPADSSNNHFWIQGDWSTMTGFTAVATGTPNPTC